MCVFIYVLLFNLKKVLFSSSERVKTKHLLFIS